MFPELRPTQPFVRPQRPSKTAHAATKDNGPLLSAWFLSKAPTRDDEWYVDSGASDHMTPHFIYLRNYELYSTPCKVHLGDGTVVFAEGKGSIELYSEHTRDRAELLDVCYVPALKQNLFSSGTMARKNFGMTLRGVSWHLYDPTETLVATGKLLDSNLTRLDVLSVLPPKVASLAAKYGNALLWHLRLGHASPHKLMETAKMVKGMSISPVSQPFICDPCVQAKAHREAVSSSHTHRSTERLERVHTDVCGPFSTLSHGKSRYVVNFIEDSSRFVVNGFLPAKSDTLQQFKYYVEWCKTKFGRAPKILRLDNGGEYASEEFKTYCKSEGIEQE